MKIIQEYYVWECVLKRMRGRGREKRVRSLDLRPTIDKSIDSQQIKIKKKKKDEKKLKNKKDRKGICSCTHASIRTCFQAINEVNFQVVCVYINIIVEFHLPRSICHTAKRPFRHKFILQVGLLQFSMHNYT